MIAMTFLLLAHGTDVLLPLAARSVLLEWRFNPISIPPRRMSQSSIAVFNRF